MSASAPIGIAADLKARRDAIVAANPQAAKRILGADAAKTADLRKAIPKPVFPRGRYIPPSIGDIITIVARVSGIQAAAILGEAHTRALVHARFAIANLTEEFAPRVSPRAVEDAMNRGDGLCKWYRERHRDRLELYPEYLRLHADCVAVMRAKSAGEA